MNTNSCTAGWATDEIFICDTYEGKTPPCQAPIAAYAALMGALILLRIWTLLKQIQVWSKREALRKRQGGPVSGPGSSQRKRQYPFVALNGALTVIVLIVFTVLTCLNLVSCRNGGSAPLLFIYFSPMLFTAVTYGARIMRLGRTLIPLSKAQLRITPQQENKIMHPDKVLTVLTFLPKVVWGGNAIALLIVAPIFPGNYLPIAVGLYLYGILDSLVGIAWAWQVWRLAIVASGAQNRDKDGGKINSVIAQLKLNSISLVVVGQIVGSLWIMLAVQLFPFAWYLVFLVMSSETMMSFVFASRLRVAASRGTSSLTEGSASRKSVPNENSLPITTDATNKSSETGNHALVAGNGNE